MREGGAVYSAGFTLLEMLLGLAILSVLLGTFYAVFSSGLLMNKKIHASENYYSEISDTLDLLARDLENAVPYSQDGGEGMVANGGFWGTKDIMRFLLPAESGLREVRYYLVNPDRATISRVIMGSVSRKNVAVRVGDVQENKAQWLVREEKAFRPQRVRADVLGGDIEILTRHVQEGTLKFEYARHDQDKALGDLSWQEQWQDVNFPAGVRVSFVFFNPRTQEEPLSVLRDVWLPCGSWGTQ